MEQYLYILVLRWVTSDKRQLPQDSKMDDCAYNLLLIAAIFT